MKKATSGFAVPLVARQQGQLHAVIGECAHGFCSVGAQSLVEIDPKGEKFDPHRHQAMAMVDSAEPPNTVAQVFQKGYLLADRVLRPAMVAVSKPKTDEFA